MNSFRWVAFAAVFALISRSATTLCQQATPATKVLSFSAAELRVPAASAQTLTATFAVSGYSGSFTPTATLHYGHDYSLGPVTCNSGGGGESCSVSVTFQPSLPGGRKDAIFLLNGSTRIGTMLVYGFGQGPLSAVEPGVVSYATALPFSNYYYGSTIDENGIIYALTNAYDTVYRIAKDGTITTLDVAGAREINSIAIDGAGVLYLGCFSNSICTYDTVSGTVGSIPVPWTTNQNDFQENVTIDGVGDLFSIESAPNNGIIEELKTDGTHTSTTLNPELVQPSQITTDSAGNVFVGGYSINELTTAGVQTQVNKLSASEGVAVDASETLYATRYDLPSEGFGVAELPPGGYSTANGFLDKTGEIGEPLGIGLGSDGTLGVGVYTNYDIVDRTRGAIDFQTATIGATVTETADIRNIGNMPLTITSVNLSGDGYVLGTGTGDCAANTVLAVGELCKLVVTWSPTHAGDFPGAVTVVSDSLGVTTTQTVTLTGVLDGAYLAASPASLNFGSQAEKTTSTARTITLTNVGNYPAHITGIASSDPAFALSAGNCESGNIAASGSCQMTVTFSPTTPTTYTASLNATSSTVGTSTSTETTTIGLTGTGTGPQIPDVSLTPTTLAFGNQYVGFTGPAQTATLSNTGTGPLAISSIVLGGANSSSFADTTTCGSSLAAGASCLISATVTPTVAGALSAAITVTDNASGSPHKLTLSGTGIAVPVATLSPTSLNFGSHVEGSTSSAMTLTLSNPSSTLALNFDSLSISGAGSASFSQTNSCGSTIAASGGCSISVTFTPTTFGSLSATLAVVTRYSGFGPVSISATLTGVGTIPPVPTLTPSVLAFGNQVIGKSSSPLVATLTNTGIDTLVIDSLAETVTGPGTDSYSTKINCPGQLAPKASCTVSVGFKPASLGTSSFGFSFETHYDLKYRVERLKPLSSVFVQLLFSARSRRKLHPRRQLRSERSSDL